jgi:hypothetical protein
MRLRRTGMAVVAASCLAALAAQAAPEGFSAMWRMAHMTPQAGWKPYAGHDTWPGVIGGRDYVIRFGRPLPPGRYRIQVRTLNVPALMVKIGGQSLSLDLVRGAFSKPLDFETGQPAEGMTLRVVTPETFRSRAPPQARPRPRRRPCQRSASTSWRTPASRSAPDTVGEGSTPSSWTRPPRPTARPRCASPCP